MAQQHELGFQLGRIAANSRVSVRLGSGTSLGFNYAYRLADLGKVALYGEAHFLANSQQDFYSGSPAYNIPSLTGDQRNVVVSGGFVISFH